MAPPERQGLSPAAESTAHPASRPAGGPREATPGEIFGAASRPGTDAAGAQADAVRTHGSVPAYSDPSPLRSDAVFQVSTLLVAVGYCLLIHYFRSCVTELVKLLRSKIYTEKLLSEANHTFSLFLNLLSALGVAASAIAVVCVADILVGERIARQAGGWMTPLAVPAVAAALGVVMLYRWGAVRIAGRITLADEAAAQFWQLRKMSVALNTLLSTPVLLLLALNGGMQIASIRLIVGVFALGVGFVLHKTYVFFIQQNVSFLHWILYLCAVEILPVSLIVGLVVRNGY